MIPVVAMIKAKPGQERTLETVLKGIVGPTQKEKGCVMYDLHQDVADPRVFIFVEKWASDKDLQAHLASPHVSAAMARRAELIDSVEIRSLNPL